MSSFDKTVSVKFVSIFLIGILLGLFGSGFMNLHEGNLVYEGIQLQDNTEKWMTFMSILSTLFAVFFVYSGFRIETIYNKMSDLKEKTDTYKRLKEKEINDYVSNMKDIGEYTIQLEHTMSFIISKQYEKAIDSLMGLKQEVFVYKVPERISTCHFFLAHCHHEKNTYDDSVIAIQYINEVYEDNQLNPYKREIIDRFEKLDKIESQQLN